MKRRQKYLGVSLSAVAASLTMLSLAGCSSIEVRSPHLNIHKDGYVADSRGFARVNEESARDSAEEIAVAELIQELDELVAQDCNGRGRSESRLMLFVHGGLTSTRAAMRASSRLDHSGIFERHGVRPVYINWNSSLFSALADDLLWIKGGQRLPQGAAVFPAVAAWRLSMGFFNALPNWYYQLSDELRFTQKWPKEPAPTFGQVVIDGGLGLVHSPFSIVSTPLFSGFGRGAWEMMSRRIDMMFAVQKAPRRFAGAPDNEPGVMRTFSESLVQARARWEEQCDQFQLDFVGHSMGALVGTRLLREYPSLLFERVIFLAPASTAEDFVTTVPEYLSRNSRSSFFSFGLSNIDEGNELTLKSALFPRGSLLIWVDNFFDPILSPEDYRLGAFWNSPVFRAPGSMTLERCDRMRMIKISGQPDSRVGWPRKHGDFNDSEYLERLLNMTEGALGGMPTDAELSSACGNSCAVFSPCANRFID